MRRFQIFAAFLFVLLAPAWPARAVPEEDESLGHKIKKLFVAPTPTPHPKHKASPSPSPHHHKASSSPSPRPAHSPSASPKPSAKPSPTPQETPAPTPSATPEKKEKSEPEAAETETPTPTVSLHHAQHSAKTTAAHPGKTPSTTKTPTEAATPDSRKAGARTTAMSSDRIAGYDSYPEPVRRLDRALALTNDGLTYKYGSADPASGGMDCSGFIYYILKESGLKDVPRDAREQYIWVRKAGTFEAVLGHSEDTFELDHLKPGDLLFWTGTYHTDRDPDVTHTMIYVGREKGSNQRIMVGSSDGRTYKGQSQNGVSVFDFHVATHRRAESDDGAGPDFAGYGRVPALEQIR